MMLHVLIFLEDDPPRQRKLRIKKQMEIKQTIFVKPHIYIYHDRINARSGKDNKISAAIIYSVL